MASGMDVTWGAFEQISRTLQLRPQDLQHPPPSLGPSLIPGPGDSNDKDAQTHDDGDGEDEDEDEDARYQEPHTLATDPHAQLSL